MAASSNESFGLKIATAFSIALTVVLLVVVYFLNSNYNLELEKRVAAEKKSNESNTERTRLQTEKNDLLKLIGYDSLEEMEAVKAAVKKDQEIVKSEIVALSGDIDKTVTEFQKKIEGKGADGSQFDAIKARAKEVVDLYTSNPDQSYKASLVRLKDLAINQAKLDAAMALNYIDLRRDLDLANKLNADAKKVVEDGLATARAELDTAIKKGEEARTEVVADRAKKAEDIAALETKITNLTNELTAKIDDLEKKRSNLVNNIRDLSDQKLQNEDVLSKPGGRVTYVDSGSNMVRISVNRSQGIRPLMRFTIFDKNAAGGITSGRPKAAVEVIKVGDPAKGEVDSQARIVQTFDTSDPIKYNDLIFSVGWSYDHPQRFSLIGRIDINRDGRDDRGDLIRMIEAAGGIIEFDLPPPNADRGPGQAAVARGFARIGEKVPASVGRGAGKISGLSYAYVIDRRPSLVLYQAKKNAELEKDDTAFLKEESDATQEARDNGVRPLPLEKLLNMLGYDYMNPVEGRREAYDKAAVQQLIKPKGAIAPPTAPDTKPEGEAGSSDMPK